MVRSERRGRVAAPVVAGLAALLLLAPSEVAAQDETRRQGFWYGFGAGAGWDRLSCDVCAGDRIGGLSGYVQAGGTLRDDLLLGGEVKFWSSGEGAVNQLLGAFSLVGIWYPNPASGLHLKGGFGYLTFRAEDDEAKLTTTAFGPQFGVGLDLPVGRSLSVTPFANWMVTPFGDLTFNDTRVSGGVRSSLLQVGIGLTSH